MKKRVAAFIFLVTFLSCDLFSQRLVPFQSKDNGLWGYKEKRTGKIIVKPQYNFADDFWPNNIAKVFKNGKYGYIDSTAREIVPLIYDDAMGFTSGVSRVKLGNKWGFIDLTGKVVISIRYDHLGSNELEDRMVVTLNGKCGVIDRHENILVPFQFEDLDSFIGNHAAAKINGKWGLIDGKGNFIIPAKYDYFVNPYYYRGPGGIVATGCTYKNYDWAGGKWGVIDTAGKEIIPMVYDRLDNLESGLMRAKKNGKWGFIDNQNKVVIDFKYDAVSNFTNGFARVAIGCSDQFQCYGGKLGYINKTGQEVIPVKYDGLGYYIDKGPVFACIGCAEYYGKYNGGKFGYVDTTGNAIIPFVYDYVNPFFEYGMLLVSEKGKLGFVDSTNKIILPIEYDHIGDFVENMAWVCKGCTMECDDPNSCWVSGGNFGYINSQGELIIPLVYTSAADFQPWGEAEVEKDGKQIVIDKKGNVIPKKTNKN